MTFLGLDPGQVLLALGWIVLVGFIYVWIKNAWRNR